MQGVGWGRAGGGGGGAWGGVGCRNNIITNANGKTLIIACAYTSSLRLGAFFNQKLLIFLFLHEIICCVDSSLKCLTEAHVALNHYD